MASKRTIPIAPKIFGYCAIFILIFGLVVWGTATEISSAIIAFGSTEVKNEHQVVQHPSGGVVKKLEFKNGDYVEKGEILLRFDDIFLSSDLAFVENQISEIFARRTRLQAERDGLHRLEVNELPELVTLRPKEIISQMEGQLALFDARKQSMNSRLSQLQEQKRQVKLQIIGLESQIESQRAQLQLVSDELSDVQQLFHKGLAQSARVFDIQKKDAELRGQIGQLVSQVAEARAKVSEIETQKLALKDNAREGTIQELSDLDARELHLLERRRILLAELDLLDVSAPVSGVVFDAQVFAERSVVQPGAPMLYIIPNDQPMQVSAQINPVDVDQIYRGQEVSLVFSAFSRQTTPQVKGTVQLISADASSDDRSGKSFYEVIIAISDSTLVELEDLDIRPGMPVEVYFSTGERSPMSYILHPLAVYFSRAFKEE